MAAIPQKRVCCIQSHVVSGYVGNKCAVFPLQLLGFEVDPIMSVQFSNHTGYPTVKGSITDGDALGEIATGLLANDLLKGYTHVLTGYIGSVSFLRKVLELVQQIRASSADVQYVCDPVLGDEGQLYVSQDLVRVYRDEVIPHVHTLTPNQFELELLTGRTLASEADVRAACEALHERGVRTVVVTSTSCIDEEALVLVASTRESQADGRQAFKVTVQKLDAYFTGTGDLLAALILARTSMQPDCISAAVESAVSSLQAILRDTAAVAGADAVRMDARSADAARRRELRIIQNRAAIEDPVVSYKAVAIAR